MRGFICKSVIIAVCGTILHSLVTARHQQQTTFPANPDGFKSFLLDETTLDQTLKALGPPDDDKIDKLDVSRIGKWLDPKHKEKIFRQVAYRKSPDFFKLELSFLDGKLVMIELEFKKNFQPEKLSKLFAAPFAWLGGPADLPDKPGQYPISFFPTHFPAYYNMVAVSGKTFIFVNCASGGDGRSPGRVERTRQISRVLEKK